MATFTPRLATADIKWQLAAIDPPVSARTLRNADRATAEQVKSLDLLLKAWADRGKNWSLVDALLDERLFVRTPDAMATGPVIPGRSS